MDIKSGIEAQFRKQYDMENDLEVNVIGEAIIKEANVGLFGVMSECGAHVDEPHRFHGDIAVCFLDTGYLFCILPMSVLEIELVETTGHLTDAACRLYLVDEVEKMHKAIMGDFEAIEDEYKLDAAYKLLPGMMNKLSSDRYNLLNLILGSLDDLDDEDF